MSAALISAQLYAESNFNPFARSPAGAQGIAQFMPGTAHRYGLWDPFDAQADLMQRFASVPLALAAYNAGPAPVAAVGRDDTGVLDSVGCEPRRPRSAALADPRVASYREAVTRFFARAMLLCGFALTALPAAAHAAVDVTAFNLSAGTVTFSGDSGATTADSLTLEVVDNGQLVLGHNLIGSGSTGNYASSTDLDPSPGVVQLVLGSGTNPAITVNTGTGDDELVVGSSSGPASALSTPVQFDGGGGTDELRVVNTADPAGRSYQLTGSSVTGAGGSGLGFTNTEGVAVFGGDGSDRFEVTLAAPPASEAHGGGGGDRVALADGAALAVVDGGSGADTLDYSAYTTAVAVTPSSATGVATSVASVENFIGGSVGDSLEGTAAPNVLTGGPGEDTLRGGAGGDFLSGGDGDDELFGDAGADTLDGGPGADGLNCGAPEDTLVTDSQDTIAADCVPAQTSTDPTPGDQTSGDQTSGDPTPGDPGPGPGSEPASEQPLPGGCANELTGTAAGERLDGSAFGDLIRGLAGDDILVGGAGVDCLEGAAGDDYLWGNDGGDWLWGGADDDGLHGRAGDDRLRGEGGADYLSGRNGDDSLKGGSGDDRLRGQLGDDYLSGGDGDDRIDGGLGTNRYFGRDGDDRLDAANGSAETVNCGPGTDAATVDRADETVGCETIRRG